MIKARISNLGHLSGDREFPIIEGELLNSAVSRAIGDVDLGDYLVEEVFQVLVNGHKIHSEFWPYTKLSASDNVLIAPILKGGNTGQILKQVAIIVIAAAASAYFPPAIGMFWGYVAAAGVTIASTLLLNGLIPPPSMDSGASVGGNLLENSQMYSIGGQSNAVKKLGFVPKVYGNHKVYPLIAANPYVQLEVDPQTQEIVQVLYAVYDFGFGPMQVSSIKIGDTRIEQFNDVQYNLVDPNKPTTDEGPWDEDTTGTFQIYKGDSDVSNLGIVLSGNQSQGGPEEDWRATRTTGSNPDGVSNEIILSFVCPGGLIAFDAGGNKSIREIELNIQFAPTGTGNWMSFNDLQYVSDFSAIGGKPEDYTVELSLFPMSLESGNYNSQPIFPYKQITSSPDGSNYNTATKETYFPTLNKAAPVYYQQFGVPKGTKTFVVRNDSRLQDGQTVKLKGQYLGTIQNIYGGFTWNSVHYAKIDVSVGTASSVPLFTYISPNAVGLNANGTRPGSINYYPVAVGTTGKIASIPPSTGKGFIGREETGPVYAEFRFKPKMRGQFDVRVTRVNSKSTYLATIQDTLQWSSINTRYDRAPIVTDKRHVFLEIKIKATNQLNGVVQNLNAICSSVIEAWDGDEWVKGTTNNPAWVFADLLTSEINKKAIPKDRLHIASLVEWAEFCDEVPDAPPGKTFHNPRFQSNFILDYNTTLQNVLNQVSSAAQASLNIIDGKYGVLVDKYRDVPVQVFTPRNSRDFQSIRNYGPRPHGLKIKYIDPTLDWAVSEAVVYDDGYDDTNAEEFEELTSFACTNYEQAWRFGRYMLAQNRLRQETISIQVDFEHLVCTRGDFVQITQDVMRVGGVPARVRSITGNQIVIDDGLNIDPEISYGYVLRARDGQIVTSTLTPVFSDTFDLDGQLPEVGDLVVIGEVSTLVYDCIVKSISPNDDLSAQLVLVEKADAIYDAESTTDLPDYNPRLSPTSDSVQKPPGVVRNLEVTDNAYYCLADRYQHYVDLDWDNPIGAVETFEIYANTGKGYNLVDRTRDSVYRYLVDSDRLDIEHSFKVLAVSATGLKIELIAAPEVTATPLTKTSLPSDVGSLASDITGEVLQLVWQLIPDCGCREYRIRFSPLTEDASWGMSIPLLKVDRNVSSVSTQARTGTYLIKAVDFNGNESETEAVAITTIPELFNLNVIEEIVDSPDFDGIRDRVEVIDTGVFLSKDLTGGIDRGYYSEGYYYYEDILDLGEIYTVRLQSLIQAEGFAGDFMEDWITLSSVGALATAGSSDWDVETQYRSTDQYNVIGEWDLLTDVAQLNAGTEENFTPWRKFAMGDATGRIFQFRLKLISNVATVTPRVFDATIKADMPDRVDSYHNLLADNTTGYILEYDTPFKGPGTTPAIQISLDNGGSGDYWEFTSKTLEGFQIKFYDKDDIQVSRQFDVVAKGYGRGYSSVI